MEAKGYRNWWMLAVNGIIAILFGLMVMLLTRDEIVKAVSWFGIIVLAGGVLLTFSAIRNIRNDRASLISILEAVVTLAIGAVILLSPANSLKLFMIMIGIWAVIIGIVQLVILINIRDKFGSRNILLFGALFTLALGILLFFDPLDMALIIVKIIGGAFTLFGILMVYFSFLLRTSGFSKGETTEAGS